LHQNSLRLYPRSHPERIKLVYKLAERRYERHDLSQEKEDLDKYIVHLTEAILLPPVSRASDIPRLLFDLTIALQERSDKYEQRESTAYCINYFRYFRRFPIDSFNIPRSDLTTSLIRALGTQVEWGSGNETRDINEMVTLCRELLTSNFSGGFPIAAFIFLASAANAEYARGRFIEWLDEVIECLRDAVKVCPLGSDNASSRFRLEVASQLRTRFTTTHSLDDYEEATALLENILDPNQPGGCPDSIRGEASLLLTDLAVARDIFFRNPEYTEVAISRLRAILSSSFIDDEESRFHFTQALSIRVKERFENYSLSESLEEANSNISQLVGLSSSLPRERSGLLLSGTDDFRETYSTTAIQQKIQNLEELLSNTPPRTERHKECLIVLADWYGSKFQRTKDTSDIKESIKYSRMSLDATRASDPWRINPLISLSNILFLAFEETKNIGYLNESIAIDYDISGKGPEGGHYTRFKASFRVLDGEDPSSRLGLEA
jgi:tetratricopeptide (TPR) repeat protein